MSGVDELVARALTGEQADLAALEPRDHAEAIAVLIGDPRGRRWLRSWAGLDTALAARLLAFPADVASRRRDATLERLVAIAPFDALEEHAGEIAGGAAAAALWRRLASDVDQLQRIAERVVVSSDAAETTLYLLVLDSLDPYGLGDERRIAVAQAALASLHAGARGVAVEYLADAAPDVVVTRLDHLSRDEDERVRGVAWLTGLRIATVDTFERVLAFIIDESAPIEHRRSALIAAGVRMPTSAMADLLSVIVSHPNERLAHDAADLLYTHHRNPITAEAARLSPHPEVREIAEALLDPRRGSPAAGGSRPGDPTRTIDIFKALLERGDDPAGGEASRR